MKLDIACGQHKQPGFKGIDIADIEGVDIVHDLTQFPWPLKTGSVSEVYCSHYVEHTPDLVGFMNELHRVCRKGATVTIRHPYCMSKRAFQDPTHLRFIPEETWYYFDQNWLKANGLDHYPIHADFEVVVIAGDGIAPSVQGRTDEHVNFARNHYWNVIADLVVELKVRKGKK